MLDSRSTKNLLAALGRGRFYNESYHLDQKRVSVGNADLRSLRMLTFINEWQLILYDVGTERKKEWAFRR